MMKCACITGAASGIGEGVARKLAEMGYPLALADNDEGRLLTLAQQFQSKGASVYYENVDVSEAGAMKVFVESAAKKFGGVSIAVACAGIAQTGQVPIMAPSVFSRMMQVNAGGVYALAHFALPHIIEAGGGSFVAIASDAALNGFQEYGAYCASKHAVLGLVKSMALDHARQGVRCNAICPGYVETPMLDRLIDELGGDAAEFENAVPLGRFATPSDVANLVGFIISDAGSYINGAALSLDGGGCAGPFAPPRL